MNTSRSKPEKINIINVPSDIGSIYAGKSRAPAAFRSAGLQDQLKASGFYVTEQDALLDTPANWQASSKSPNGARNEAATIVACEKVHTTVKTALEEAESSFHLILSGECLFCPAILSAYWWHLRGTPRRVGMIYFDADCDLYAPNDSNSSGNIAGMTLTHLTLRDGTLKSMKRFSRPDGSGVVDCSNIVLYGLNVGSEANKREHLGYLFDNGFRVVTSQAVQRDPVQSARSALQWLEDRVDYVVVHLDVDAIDPGEFPLCNVPSWTGLGFQEAMAAVKVFLKSEKVVILSIAEVNPDHDPGLRMTKKLVDEIIDGLKRPDLSSR
ncbi:Arginase/deacetylase [Corynespora cassiicola Philippines]|uniref:Arginase/deacetylase n=1 Tax=Corynespora cassiicola Philippines TaxID=1448308 RepID=A0A2T2P918_CORCC|nr:Arginase/deacetylase [Corynespora cassiicola Philippines]